MAKTEPQRRVHPDNPNRPWTRAAAAQEAARLNAPLVGESPRLPGAYDSSQPRRALDPRGSELTPLPQSHKAFVRSYHGSSSSQRSREERPPRPARAEERVPAGRSSIRQQLTVGPSAVPGPSASRIGEEIRAMNTEERRLRRREKARRDSSESSQEAKLARRTRRIIRTVSIMVENGLVAGNCADQMVETLLQSYSSSEEGTNKSYSPPHPVERQEPASRPAPRFIPEEQDAISQAMNRLRRPRDTEETSEEYRRRVNAAERQETSVRIDRDISRNIQPEPAPRVRESARREQPAERAGTREDVRVVPPESRPRSKYLKTSSEAYHALIEAEATIERKKREAKKADRNTRRERERRSLERSYHYDRRPPPNAARNPPQGGPPDDSSDGDDSDESYRADGDATDSDAASSTTTRSRNRYTRR